MPHALGSVEHSITDSGFAERWIHLDWNGIDERISEMQRELSIASRDGDEDRLAGLTECFLSSFEARAKAVANVTRNESTKNPGMGEQWTSPSDRYKAALILDHHGYRTEPFYSFTMFEPKTKKDRTMCIPTFYDRAMHDLFRMLMEPVCEPLYDRRLFSSRKGRSLSDATKEVEYLFSGNGSPEWVVRCDVKSFYDTMSHEWLLDNVPMDRGILEQFLKAPRYENGKGDPIGCDSGVPTGNRMSPVLANLILNGLEDELKDPSDPENGIVIRWVDDIVITARTEEDALRFKAKVLRFVKERGMELNERKSYVANVKEGFEFLKYRFVKVGDSISMTPIQDAVDSLLEETKEAVKKCRSEDEIVKRINNHIRGFTNKYRIADMSGCAEQIDKGMIDIAGEALSRFGNMTAEEAFHRYVRKDDKGWYLKVSSGLRVKRISEYERVPHDRIWLSANPYVDKDYFENRVKSEKIGKIANDDLRSIWNSTDGHCGICGLRIRHYEPREIVSDEDGRKAYVHVRCSEESLSIHGRVVLMAPPHPDEQKEDEPEPMNPEDSVVDSKEIIEQPPENILPVVETSSPKGDDTGPIQPRPSQMRLVDGEGMSITIPRKKGVSKFQPLIDIVCRVKLQFLDYSFSELDNIITGGLCASAYRDIDWWRRRGRASIGEALDCIGYRVEHIDIDRQRVRISRRTQEYQDSEKAYRSRHNGPDAEKRVYERSERMRKSKFGALTRYLLECGMDQVILSFDKVGEIIGGLPPSAEERFWWSTRKAGPLTSIEDADFTKVKVDFKERTVLLTRTICIPNESLGNVVVGDLPLKEHMTR